MNVRDDSALALWDLSSEATFALDSGFHICDHNAAARRLSGGRTGLDTVCFVDLIDAHERDSVIRALRRASAGEKVTRFEASLVSSDGIVAAVSMSLVALGDGVLVVAHDRSEELESQEMLAEASDVLDNAERLAQFGMWLWDRESDVVQWTDGLHEITGIGPFEFAGSLEAHLEPIHPEDRERVRAAIESAAKNFDDEFDESYRLLDATGAERRIESRARRILDGDGSLLGLRGVCQDITVQHELAEILRLAAESEREAARLLREADRTKDDFLSTVSHELRTPIQVLTGFLSVLSASHMSVSEDQRADLIGRMARNANDLRDMVERLLDFTRLEAGRMEVQVEPMVLVDSVTQVVNRLDTLVTTHQLDVSIDKDIVVLGDPNAVSHVVSNLLTNAAKYSDDGTSIQVSAIADDDSVTITIVDQGVGIAPEHHESVFERFFRVPDTAGSARGTGVGLAVVSQYVELMGGTISIDSSPGVGSTFTVSLPIGRL